MDLEEIILIFDKIVGVISNFVFCEIFVLENIVK